MKWTGQDPLGAKRIKLKSTLIMAELIYSLSVKMTRAGVVTATDNC